MKVQLLVCFVFSFFIVNAQAPHGIKLPGKEYYKRCEECARKIQTKPKEVEFGVQRDELDYLYFVISRKEWVDVLFKKSNDGIALDIVSKDRYSCANKKLKPVSWIRGEVQRPIYLKELKQYIQFTPSGGAVIPLGQLPEKFKDKEVECNLMILKDKYLCYYQSFIDLKTYRWDLLDMGFYFDRLTYKSNFKSLGSNEKYILQQKMMRFEIPFERNKAEYSQEDIKPLYDSLKLTDFTITNISIRAYSSVEGTLEHNLSLQDARAKSIVKALQTFQLEKITTDISSSENWVDFMQDVSKSPYTSLTLLSKEEIKEKLKDKKLEQQLEPYLQQHRKAVLVLSLQKKNKFEKVPVEDLLSLFNTSISEKNLEQAIAIQNAIFEKVKNLELPTSYVDRLEVPQKSEYGSLLNKNSIFKFLMDEDQVLETYKQLTTLADFLPEDAHLKYNICALKFKVWLLGENVIDPSAFKKEILALGKLGIDQKLIKRMLINYEVLMSEYFMMKGDFRSKDNSLHFIHVNYPSISLSDADLLNLAQYFSSYAKYDWAIKLLDQKVKNIEAGEDMLFYYLNLTLIDEQITKRTEYRTILLNAYNLNPVRFCELFKPFGKGGLSFQLLENEYLRKNYCENCSK